MRGRTNLLTSKDVDEAVALSQGSGWTLRDIGDLFGVSGEAIAYHVKRRGLRYHPPTMEQRFWARVVRAAGDACWLWIGARNSYDYGWFRGPERSEGAHRMAWRLTHGAIPAGKIVLHSCDNPPCVRPSHLWLGTHADNAHDRDAKGRQRAPLGEMNGGAKLTADLVRDIRRRADHGEHQRGIARALGVSQSAVGAVLRAETWRHVPVTEDDLTAAKAHAEWTEAEQAFAWGDR